MYLVYLFVYLVNWCLKSQKLQHDNCPSEKEYSMTGTDLCLYITRFFYINC